MDVTRAVLCHWGRRPGRAGPSARDARGQGLCSPALGQALLSACEACALCGGVSVLLSLCMDLGSGGWAFG